MDGAQDSLNLCFSCLSRSFLQITPQLWKMNILKVSVLKKGNWV